MVKYELVVPAYNESLSLEIVIKETVLAAKQAGFTARDFQLVIVQNGSTDDSAENLCCLKNQEFSEWFRVITLKENIGYGGGIWEGLKETTAPIVGWMHGDLQCDSKESFIAYAKLLEADNKKLLIKGHRFGRGYKEIFISRSFEFCAFLALGFRCFEINAPPKVFHRSLLGEIKNPPRTLVFDLYFLYQATKAGYQIATIPIQMHSRIHGSSKWSYSFLSRYRTIYSVLCYMMKLRRIG